ncbi:iron-containing redox enzyme family protein [Hydrocarboniphaga effusa]|uniref:iron-containing redox enzyme family protein n=1 Tax=Hydrocarboniphaga effusa TaxID=243629 RepID=UPI0035B31A3D
MTTTSRCSSSLRFADGFHRQLAQLNDGRLRATRTSGDPEADLDREIQIRRLELAYIEHERGVISDRIAHVPTQVNAFIDWFESLKQHGPGQGDALFPWLAEYASLSQMRWFLTQEVAGEAGFDDLVALTQLGLPDQAKLELARNYWDEMGRGRQEGMHGLMLRNTSVELKLAPRIDFTVWEALALANTMLALASSRRYAYQSIGALGVVELTAPTRVSKVCEGLRRLGISTKGYRYFQLHAGLDIKHSEDWNREVLRPLVLADPACAKLIAEGALLRLRCGERCFERYRREFGIGQLSHQQAA